MVAQQPATPTHPGIVLSGIVPPLADTFFTRTETGPDLTSSLRPGETVVLVHGGESDPALVAQGEREPVKVLAQVQRLDPLVGVVGEPGTEVGQRLPAAQPRHRDDPDVPGVE